MPVTNKPITIQPPTDGYRTDAAGRACQCAECVAARKHRDNSELQPPIELTVDETARITEAQQRGDQGTVNAIVNAARVRARGLTGHAAEQTLMDAARKRMMKR